MTEHIVQHTNLHSAPELQDPVKTSTEETENLPFMGVFNFPAKEEQLASCHNMIDDIMTRQSVKLLHHFSDNHQCNCSQDFTKSTQQFLPIPSVWMRSLCHIRSDTSQTSGALDWSGIVCDRLLYHIFQCSPEWAGSGAIAENQTGDNAVQKHNIYSTTAWVEPPWWQRSDEERMWWYRLQVCWSQWNAFIMNMSTFWAMPVGTGFFQLSNGGVKRPKGLISFASTHWGL